MYAAGLEYFTGDGGTANMFDTCIVSMLLGEQIISAQTQTDEGLQHVVSVLRMFRLLRIVRLLRVLRLVEELYEVVDALANSFTALCPVMGLLCLFFYMFSIVF